MFWRLFLACLGHHKSELANGSSMSQPGRAVIRQIGFVGAGLMGTPMVRRLLGAGFQVRVWNRTPEKLTDLIAAGANLALSAADAANNSDAVLLCVTDATAVDAVLFEEQGVADAVNAPPLL